MATPRFDHLIRRCNVFLGFLYPDPELQLEGEEYKHQFRDLIRSFMAGALECAILREDQATVNAWVVCYQQICAIDWWPDARYKREFSKST